MTIDTLAYAQKLEAAGVDRNHAEAHAAAMRDHVLPQIATKADILELRHDLTWRMLGIAVAANGVLFALLRFV